MAMRKNSKWTKTATPTPFVSKTTHHNSPGASAPAPSEKRPAPMSWKDAVQRAPAQPQPPLPASPQKKTTFAKSKEVTSMQPPSSAMCTPTKLAARSRSISRIVQSSSFKKQNEFFPSAPEEKGLVAEADGQQSHASSQQQLPTNGAANKKAGVAKQVSFSSNDQISVADKKTRTDSDTQRFAELVQRLGLNDTHLMLSQSYTKVKAGCCGGRPRSASADDVLLPRASPPMWLLAESPVSLGEVKLHRDSTKWSRKHRAMSVPNASASGSIYSLSEEKASALDSSSKRIFELTEPRRQGSEEENSELDSEDTHSESTADSSCSSPRHSLVSPFGIQHTSTHVDLSDHSSVDEMDDFSDWVTPEDEEEDLEAYMLLDRINSLSAEFKAHRKYEECSALAWSVQHAARQGMISPQLQQNLLANIRNGSWEEARDVLYHKCHLVPAVGSVPEPMPASPIDPAIEASFERCVDELAPADSTDDRLQKLRVLKLLSDLLTAWVKFVGYERGLSEEHVALTSGSLFLAGSYRLGLNDPLSDIDAVCVVPYHVTHEDFFSSFCSMLEQMNGVTHLAPVPNAYVPLISLQFLGVNMDLLFARLPMAGVEAHQEIDSDHILVGVDPTSMKSLNAPRVSSMLLCLVPRRRTFRIVLRAVRSWARRRGIYSSKLGYLGGISWSILVAFVCQMYPEAEPSKLFVRFFQVFSEWQWPRPVMLNMVYDAGLGFEMWDPRQNLYDRSHIMPIVTPAYPHMNSAVQVSQSTFSVIYEEIWRARYLAEAADGVSRSLSPAAMPAGMETPNASSVTIAAGSVSAPALRVETTPTALGQPSSVSGTGSECEWDKLFQRSNFFIRYESYLVVDFNAETSSSMHVWGKFVQSRLRKLVDSLQHLSFVQRVHAFPLYFPNTSKGETPGSCVFIGIEFHSRSRSNADMHGLVKDDPEMKANLERTIRFFLATDLQQLAERKQDMCAEARLLQWAELPDFVFENGRPAALVERAEYHEDMERMMTQSHGPQFRSPGGHYNNGGDRFGSGKWRSPNGQRNGGGRHYGNKNNGQKQSRGGDRYREGGQKPFYIAHGG